MKQLTQQQIAFMMNLIARFKSRSPKGYRALTVLCTVGVSLMGTYCLCYGAFEIVPASWEPVSGHVYHACEILGAAATTMGLTAASTTTEPSLMSKDTQEKINEEKC